MALFSWPRYLPRWTTLIALLFLPSPSHQSVPRTLKICHRLDQTMQTVHEAPMQECKTCTELPCKNANHANRRSPADCLHPSLNIAPRLTSETTRASLDPSRREVPAKTMFKGLYRWAHLIDFQKGLAHVAKGR